MSRKEEVNVVIDSNEAAQNPDMTEVFIMHEDVEDYLIEPMSEGDIRIDDCLFERKAPSDFASSLQEGRLREQVERLGSREEASFILVEGSIGDFENLSHTDIPAKSLRGMVASITARNNIPVVFCDDGHTLADMAVRLARKTKEATTPLQTRSTDAVEELDFVENVFRSVEGIGVETAKVLGDEFKSLEQVLSASEEDFMKVDGIGQERATKLLNTIQGPEKESETESNDGDGERTMVTI